MKALFHCYKFTKQLEKIIMFRRIFFVYLHKISELTFFHLVNHYKSKNSIILMKKIFYLCVLLSFATSCSKSAENNGHDHTDESEHAVHEAHEHHDDEESAHEGHHHGTDLKETESDGEITLSAERSRQLGVATLKASINPISDVMHVTGEAISDPRSTAIVTAPSAGTITFGSGLALGNNVARNQTLASVSASNIAGGDAVKAARIQYDSALAEVERLKPLRELGIVTLGEYNAALQALELAKNALNKNGATITAPISGTISTIDATNGQYVEAGATVATISDGGNMTVRADVPKRYASAAAKATKAIVKDPYTNLTVDATLAARPTSAVGAPGYIPVYFNIINAGNIAPGSYVDVYIISDSGKKGVSIPIGAITDRFGQKFVYVKLDDECYERRAVTIGSIDGRTAEITSGINEGDEIVTEGVTFIRLAETSNVAVPGHTHNH